MKRSEYTGWIQQSVRAAGILALCATCAVGVSGCKGKKPPPPPPPVTRAPPPPTPPAVSFDSISQELKTDARVQFAPSIEISDPELVRSVVNLCDALAKGDADRLARLSNRKTKDLVTSMQSSGEWSQGTSDIEAVRLIFVGKNDETTGFKITLDDVTKAFSGEKDSVEEASWKIPADVFKQIAPLFQLALAQGGGFDIKNFDPPMTAEKLVKIREAWDKIRSDTSESAAAQQIVNMLSAATTVPGLKDAEYMALVAVQSPEGVELMGWGIEKAFDKWTFNPASTDRKQRARAADWDGIGIAGFSRDSRGGTPKPTVKKADGEEPKDGTKPPGEEKKDDPGEQQKPPPQKRTPNGPVKLPGGG